MSLFRNPFNQDDPDRYSIWIMLVKRDIEAFMKTDWKAVAGDFIEEGFMGIDARFLNNPDSWKFHFNLTTLMAEQVQPSLLWKGRRS